MSQATVESLTSLRQIDSSGLSRQARNNLRALLEGRHLLKPRSSRPKLSREDIVGAFQRILEGDWTDFLKLVQRVPDGEKDAVAVLKVEEFRVIYAQMPISGEVSKYYMPFS
jgi:hypothetical protein